MNQIEILAACNHPGTNRVRLGGGRGSATVCDACWNASVEARRADAAAARPGQQEANGAAKRDAVAYWQMRGVKPGDTVRRFVASMLGGGVTVEGTAKVGVLGPYVSAPQFQPGRLAAEGWVGR